MFQELRWSLTMQRTGKFEALKNRHGFEVVVSLPTCIKCGMFEMYLHPVKSFNQSKEVKLKKN